MAYADFEAEVGDWLARSDLVAVIPSFIKLAEAKFYRRLRLRALETRLTLPAVDGVVTMPPEFLKVITILFGECKLNYVTRYTKSNSLSDTQYSTEGFDLLVGPNVDEVEVVFYQRLPALIATPPDDTNWVLENAYDVYLYGVLLEATPYLQDDSRLAIWAGLYDTAIKELLQKDKSDKLGEGPLVPTRVVGWTP